VQENQRKPEERPRQQLLGPDWCFVFIPESSRQFAVEPYQNPEKVENQQPPKQPPSKMASRYREAILLISLL
jgi:hypothetical protein